ncbi:MAG: AGE family epimerase/isomerase [Bacteroidales bacterium]|nr:AGE family epimerase/isomerase [Bacteroidales bacterium]
MLSSTSFKKELSILEEEAVTYWVEFFAAAADFGTSPDKHTGEEVMGAKRYSNTLKGICTAYSRTQNEQYLIVATKAKDFILENFLDNKYGGIHYTLTKTRERCSTDKKLSSQAACLSALATYVAAFKNENVLNYAVGIFKTIEKDLKDERLGGYFNAADRSFQDIINPAKKLKGHILLLDAYVDLYKVYPQTALREAIINLIDLIIGKFLSESVIPYEFNDDWSETSAKKACPALVYNTCGSILKAAFAVGSFSVVERVREAVAPLVKACDENSNIDADKLTYKHGIVPVNVITGAIVAWKYLGDAKAIEVIEKTWNAFKPQTKAIYTECPCAVMKLSKWVFEEI